MSRFIFVFSLFTCLFCVRASAQDAVIGNPSVCGIGAAIPDYNCHLDGTLFQPYTVEINVGNNAPGAILGQDVFLSKVNFILLHSWTKDIKLTLESPSGQRQVVLIDQAGGGEDDFGSLAPVNCSGVVELSMTACNPISTGSAPFLDGPFLPEENLFNFNDGMTSANGTWTLYICDQFVGDVGTLEFFELVFEPMSCLPITDISLDEGGVDSVTVSWHNPQMCETVILEYGSPGFIPGVDSSANEGIVDLGQCSPHVLNGLVPDTEYELYVRTYCSASGIFSSNSCPFIFRTGCLPPPVSLWTDFDDLADCSTNCTLPCLIDGIWENVKTDSIDWIVHDGMTPTPGTGPSSDVSGSGNYIYFETSGCIDAEAHLLSKCIQLDKMGTDTCNMSFFYNMKGIDMGTLRLDVTSDGAQSWQPLWQKEGNQGSDWHQVHIGLGDFMDGDILQFRFVAIYANGSSGDMALDNIAFHGSHLAGEGAIRYYLDDDGDGYGQTDVYLDVCSETPPSGFTFFSGDCDDSNAMINPGMPEIPCDGADNNCNGDVINDDLFLPSLITAVSDTVCNTASATISAVPEPGNSIYWYQKDDLNTLFWIGDSYTYFVQPNNTAFPLVDTFYVGQGRNFSCFSETLLPVYVVTNPTPSISFIDIPNPCSGEEINLANINYLDEHFTGAQLDFYQSLPIIPENLLESTIVEMTFSQTFYYEATSPQGCREVGSLSILVKPLPQISYLPGDSFAVCVNAQDTVYVLGGGTGGPYSFLWSNGSTQPQIAVTGQEEVGALELFYTTITDAFGCRSIDSVQIETSNSIDSVRVFVDDVNSCSGHDGSISVIPLNGVSPFSYEWQGPGDMEGSGFGVVDTIKISNLTEGVYNVFIFDDEENGCDFNLVNVIVQGPNAVIEAPVIQPVSCHGGDDGMICVHTIGVAGYAWSTGADTECIDGLGAGVYSLTITSGDCQTILTDLLVEEPEAIVLQYEIKNPSCGDELDGMISVETYGGTPPYQFLWENGTHNPILSGISTGDYGLTVTDFLGCEYIDTIAINNPEVLEVVELEYDFISCFGANDGLIHIQGQGGVAPYRYHWSNNTSAPIIQQIADNTFLTVTVTDGNDCETIKTYHFTAPDSLRVVVLSQINPTCAGDSTGFLSLGGQGGTAPYLFYVNGNQMAGNEIMNLGVGDYGVQVEDSNGCRSEVQVVSLIANSNIGIETNVVMPECIGQETGSIDLSILGTAPFLYQWGHTEVDTSFVDGLGVGQYNLRVIDGMGCYKDTFFVLDAPQVFNPTFTAVDPSCFNVNDGLINTTFSNAGTPPFIYEWSDGDHSTSRSALMPGSYNVTISDILGCEYISDSIKLAYPPAFELEVIAVSDLVCKGDSTGFIELQLKGGTQPYKEVTWLGYNWTSLSLANLPEGDYELIATDQNDCPINRIFSIASPPELKADTAWLGMEYCRSVLEDTLVAVVTGGVEPYSYLWNNGHESRFLYGVPPDNYAYTVTDANGCEQHIDPVKFEKEIGVIQLDSFYLIDSSCHDGINLSAVVQISNGTGYYSYHFDPLITDITQESRLIVHDLIQSPHYSVSVTDLNTGCQVQSPIIPFSLPDPLRIELDSMRDVSCVGAATGAIFVSVLDGSPDYTFIWRNENGDIVGGDSTLEQQGVGLYSLEVTDSHGCSSSLGNLPLVNGNSIVKIDTVFITDVSCKGESTGSIDISVSGGRTPYQFTWDYLGGTAGEDLLSVPGGSYSVEIVDANDCRSDFFDFIVKEPLDSLKLDATSYWPSCYEGMDGKILGNVSGGGAPYLFQWTLDGQVLLGEEQDSLINISSGHYIMIVNDTFGCVKNLPVFVGEPDSLMLQINFGAPTPPQENGYIEVIPQGGIAPFSYLWSTGDTTAGVENLGEGAFEVLVTDSLGCTRSEVIELVRNKEVLFKGGIIESFRYFPNPVEDAFSINLILNRAVAVRVDIMDIFGNVQLSESHAPVLEGDFQFDTGRLATGSYIVRVYLNEEFAGAFIIIKL